MFGLSALLLAAALSVSTGPAGLDQDYGDEPDATFTLVRSEAAEDAGCLKGAEGEVEITSQGFAEEMDVSISGLPEDTSFEFFIIQVPDAPFGLSWYQGDLETDGNGKAKERFIGRFNGDTFIVAPDAAPAPLVHTGADADGNPATDPVHTFHLGLWFTSPDDAAAAGCPDAVTPFNVKHQGGIQALSTRNFPADEGPLLQVSE